MANSCKSCKFWLPVEGETEAGVCRRNPPTNFLLGVQPSDSGPMFHTQAFFPTMHIDGWCGEFKES